MLTLVTGSRDYKNWREIRWALTHVNQDIDLDGSKVTELIHGDAPGADALADKQAKDLGIKVTPVPADWKRRPDGSFDKRAGFIRNQKMIDMEPDIILAFFVKGKPCKGTCDTVNRACKANIPYRSFGRETSKGLHLPPETTVVNVKTNEYDVYIGRNPRFGATNFGNPVKIKTSMSREECIRQYKAWFWKRIQQDPSFRKLIHSLEGKRLGCHCVPKACHGHVIVAYHKWARANNKIGDLS